MVVSHPQIAVNAEAEAEARAEVRSAPHLGTVSNENDAPKDHFKSENGVRFAGSHLILDMWDAEHLDDPELLRKAMIDAVEAAGATLLHVHLHRFTPYGGVSGVAVLAESHISVHTWPENGYAAFDIFMCGDARPDVAAGVLSTALRPSRTDIFEHRRGVVSPQ
jgi:S-adenosylmethionine decarboxylase